MAGVSGEIQEIQERYRIIGREDELAKALAAIASDKHLLIEGVAGIGKTVIATAIAQHFNRGFFKVDGDERYTEHKLAGWFDPALVLARGYSWETFIPGPLAQAMTEGSLLFINELNRLPEGTQNVLLPAMDERQIVISKLGALKAKTGFLVLATQNPEEFVGTGRLSEALKDRFVWLRLDYQSEHEEREIVKKETLCNDERTIALAVRIVRKTRENSDIRHGASVRAAIDIVQLVQQFSERAPPGLEQWAKAATMALATKIQLQDRTTQKIEQVIERIVASALSEYMGNTRPETLPAPVANVRRQEGENPDATDQVRRALQNRNSADLIPLLQGNPRSLSSILLDEDLFNRIMQLVGRSEPKWPTLQFLFMSQSNLNPEQRQQARAILKRSILQIAARITGQSIRSAKYFTVPFRRGLEDFDLEETIESSLPRRMFDYNDIVCVERRAREQALSLMLDTSNSMQAGKILIAAIAVGVFACRFADDHYSIITFGEHPHLLKTIEERPDVERLIDNMLDLKPGGSTDIAKALTKGLEELRRLLHFEGTGVLITDGWVTRGGDPVEIARKYNKLHVVQVPLGTGGGDSDMCKRLAKAGAGIYSYVRDFYDLPEAIMGVTK